MECTLATLHALVACFSWSNLYVDGGLSYQDGGETYKLMQSSALLDLNTGEFIQGTARVSTAHDTSNPYGRLALGYEVKFTSVEWRLETFHLSSIATGMDRGINGVALSARWHPFK